MLERQREVLALTGGHDRVHGWVTLVGHDLMSDELVVAASEMARSSATSLTFHLSPTDSDPTSYLARTGLRPLVHLDRLGALGDHVLVAHGVHLDDAELDVLLATRTAARLLPVGVPATRAGRHGRRPSRRTRRTGRACGARL